MTQIAMVAQTQDGFTLSVAGAIGGETTFELEISRDREFRLDFSILKTAIAGAGNIVISGLPRGTVWFCRHRSTNLAQPGAWSPTLMIATLKANAPAAYPGFSILPAIVVVPEEMNAIVCPQIIAGIDPTVLTRDDPNSALITSTGVININYQMAGQEWDVVSLLGTLAGENATWRVRSANSASAATLAPLYDSGNVPFRASQNVGVRQGYHSFIRLPAPVTHRFVTILINSDAPNFIARNLVTGLARSSVNYSRGMTVSALDSSQFSRTTIGTPNRVLGWRGRSVSLELSWVSETEYEAKFSDLDWRVGNSLPVLVAPNGAVNPYFMDRIAYGVISSQSSENLRGRKWRKSLEIASIY